MCASDRRLIEKIQALPAQERKRVEGYVDALLDAVLKGDREESQKDKDRRLSTKRDKSESDDEYLDLSFRGALKDLRDRYTSVELQDEIVDEWVRKIGNS
jgi:hypothetical protein